MCVNSGLTHSNCTSADILLLIILILLQEGLRGSYSSFGGRPGNCTAGGPSGGTKDLLRQRRGESLTLYCSPDKMTPHSDGCEVNTEWVSLTAIYCSPDNMTLGTDGCEVKTEWCSLTARDCSPDKMTLGTDGCDVKTEWSGLTARDCSPDKMTLAPTVARRKRNHHPSPFGFQRCGGLTLPLGAPEAQRPTPSDRVGLGCRSQPLPSARP